MKNLDPKWAKEKLEDQLGQIEDQIDKKALSLNDERKLLAKRKELLRKNEEWLSQRKKGNPEIAEYVEASKKMNKLFTLANKLHQEMLTHVEKNEPIHAEFTEKRGELRNSMRQVEDQGHSSNNQNLPSNSGKVHLRMALILFWNLPAMSRRGALKYSSAQCRPTPRRKDQQEVRKNDLQEGWGAQKYS